MKLLFAAALLVSHLALADPLDKVLFQDGFAGALGTGWSWIREHREGWRVGPSGLEVRVEPGNMWGGANNARNVLVRDAPAVTNTCVEVSVRVENKPTEQYEQVDLVWFYSDSFMVKLGQELVDGKLSVVMGREENDRTRTIAIIPLESSTVRLRLRVTGNRIQGWFRTPGADAWRDVGTCDIPRLEATPPRISLQFYQGPSNVEHWARINEFRVRELSPEEHGE